MAEVKSVKDLGKELGKALGVIVNPSSALKNVGKIFGKGDSGAATGMAPSVSLPTSVPYPTGNPVQDAWAGTQQERNDYGQQDWLARAGIDPVEMLGYEHGTQLLRNGQPFATNVQLQQPGLQGQLARGQQDILDQITANIGDYKSTVNGQIAGLGNTFAGLNAQDSAAYDQLLSAVNGVSLAPLSLASSNPQDVARQQQSYDMLMGAANGSMDAHSNPEDVAAQAKGRDLLWELGSSPELTAQERFIYEKQRLIEEQDRRGQMMAALRNLSQRGQLGSGGEIGAMLGAQQTTSQNRLLGDLGAMSNAIDRQMTSLGQYSQLSTAMRNASDNMASGNMDRRAASAGNAANTATAMRNASDDISKFNSGQTNNYNIASTQLDQWKAQTPFNAQQQLSQNQGSRATTLTGLQVDAAGNILNAKNLIPTLKSSWLGQDTQTGLTLAEQANEEKWRRWEADWRVTDRADAQANVEKATALNKPEPSLLNNPWDYFKTKVGL